MPFALLAAAALAPESPNSYPIYVRKDRDHCVYIIQDMVMSERSDVADWLKNMPSRDWQLEVIWRRPPDKACAVDAAAIARDQGFAHVAIREDTTPKDPNPNVRY